MSIRKLAIATLVLPGLLFLALPAAAAASCSKHAVSARHARNELRHAASAADLVRAKSYARRADRALDDAAKDAAACACDNARRKFRSAALYARRAKIAKDRQQFSTELARAQRDFDTANRALRRCSPQ